MMGWGYGMMGGWSGVMLIPLILIGVIVYAVIKISSGNSNVRNTGQYSSSLEILNERFAKGELTEEEYNQRKAVLMR